MDVLFHNSMPLQQAFGNSLAAEHNEVLARHGLVYQTSAALY
jgi:hypothetical protein